MTSQEFDLFFQQLNALDNLEEAKALADAFYQRHQPLSAEERVRIQQRLKPRFDQLKADIFTIEESVEQMFRKRPHSVSSEQP